MQIDPWPTGDYGFSFEEGRRVQRCIAFYRPNPNDNGYAFPIDGLMDHVDVDTLEVLHIEDLVHGHYQLSWGITTLSQLCEITDRLDRI